jgi:hypothetical protein
MPGSVPPLADLLPFSSGIYAALTGVGLLLGVYGHAAKMPRLTIFAIALVFVSTLLTMLAVSGYDGGLPDGVKGDTR